MSDNVEISIGQTVVAKSGCFYKNLQILGRGGNAVTFLVVATSGSNRGVPFAMKVFRKLSKLERRDGFLKEMEFLETCNHPSVMRIFDKGVFEDKHPFLIAEYLPNTLYNVMRGGDVSTVVKISYTLQLLSALNYLEGLNVVHRDIKPQNIFIKGKSCVLGDFGLMKTIDTKDETDMEIIKESIGIGMPFRYRTPDLVSYLNGRSALTTKSDVFQLGLVIAELFSGRNPCKRNARFEDDVELYPLEPIRGAQGKLIRNIITNMLAFDPNIRSPASELFTPWEGIFGNVVTQAHALEGRAIW